MLLLSRLRPRGWAKQMRGDNTAGAVAQLPGATGSPYIFSAGTQLDTPGPHWQPAKAIIITPPAPSRFIRLQGRAAARTLARSSSYGR